MAPAPSTAHLNKDTEALEVAELLNDRIIGRTIVVTGISPGNIGFATARAIASHEPRLLVLAGRNEENVGNALQQILTENPSVNIRQVIFDLASLTSVRRGAEEVVSLCDSNMNVVINCAGIEHRPFERTEDGFESHFGINHLGPFVFTNLLIGSMLGDHKFGRIVNLVSKGHAGEIRWADTDFAGGEQYDPYEAMEQSKKAQMIMAVTMSRIWGQHLLQVGSVFPGFVDTGTRRNMEERTMRRYVEKYDLYHEDGSPNKECGLWRTPDQAAATILIPAFDGSKSSNPGCYYEDCQVVDSPKTKDLLDRWKLWDMSNEMVGEDFGRSIIGNHGRWFRKNK